MSELGARAARIELVLTDCDGVLTDAGVYYDERGEVMKRFSIRDGMGVERLRGVGVEVGIVSGESSPPLLARARKLRIEELHLGIKDKRSVLDSVCARLGLEPDQVAFMGDDVNDVEIMRMVGLAGAPSDALPQARESAHVVVGLPGGHGAFRAFAEMIVSARSGEEPSWT